MGLSPEEQNRRNQQAYQQRPKAVSRDLIQRQDNFLAAIAQGMPRVEAAMAHGKVKDATIDQWLARSTEFRFRYGQAKAKARGEWKLNKLPFDADFRKKFFGYSTPSHMQKLIDVINEQVAIAEKEQTRDRRVLILMPPEHGKSTVAVEEYISYRIAMDPTFRASIVCATQGKARKRLGAIGRMLTDRHAYADLIDTYGPFRAEDRLDQKPWTADYFMHVRAPAAQRDYTCQALGLSGDIYGDRMDLIVYDDIATLKNQTPAEIEKQWEKTWGECRSRVRKGGLFLVVGTHMREGDIYTVMQDRGFFTDVVIMPAIVEEPDEEGNGGAALWGEGTSLKELLKLREDDLRMFELMYQQNPRPSVGAIFTQEMLESCYDDTRWIGHVPEGSLVVAGIDPSVSNYTAAVVFALKRSETGEWFRYLVDVRNEKGLTGEGGDHYRGVIDFIIDVCRDYKVNTLCVEDGSWMTLFNESSLLRHRLTDLGVRHIPIKATEQTTGAEAIRQLSRLFTNRVINIPGDQKAKRHLTAMFNQFLTFTGEKQHWRKAFDIVKAFRQAEHAVKMMTGSHGKPAYTEYDLPGWMREAS